MILKNVRTYGSPPYSAAVIHGGPGAPGYMEPVARELSSWLGVLEPLQSAGSLDGQIAELIEQLQAHETEDLTLIGSSWGATLALLTAAQNQVPMRKLILIGSAVFDAESSAKTKQVRMSRLSETARTRFQQLQTELADCQSEEQDKKLTEIVSLLDTADFFDPITTETETIEVQAEINKFVWADFVALRDQGDRLRRTLEKVNVPVTIIHGDYDPHPLEGIEPFLRECIKEVTTHLLPNCGHYPWLERQARAPFFVLLRNELEIKNE